MTPLTESVRRFVRVAFMTVVATAAIGLFAGTAARAHCDGVDGPVVGAARVALQTSNVNHVLIWVRPQDADEIKRAFDDTLAVRKLSPQAQSLADN